jgi:hypothetical protein
VKVYLVEDTADYYKNLLIGIYSSEEKAKKVKDRLITKGFMHESGHVTKYSAHEIEITAHDVDRFY